jgi:hypothetical protein
MVANLGSKVRQGLLAPIEKAILAYAPGVARRRASLPRFSAYEIGRLHLFESLTNALPRWKDVAIGLARLTCRNRGPTAPHARTDATTATAGALNNLGAPMLRVPMCPPTDCKPRHRRNFSSYA